MFDWMFIFEFFASNDEIKCVFVLYVYMCIYTGISSGIKDIIFYSQKYIWKGCVQNVEYFV